MHRFYLPEAQSSQRQLVLPGAEAHHASRVLRVKPGEEVTVLNGRGGEFTCRITAVQRDIVNLTVLKHRAVPPLAAQLTLLQALPKGKIFDSLVQKATELGVHRIVPVLAGRSVPDFNKKDALKKKEKWNAIAVESIKQCGTAWLPEIAEPATPGEFLNRKENFELSLVASLRPGSKSARRYLDEFRAREERVPASVSVWVGPEGDFTPEEYDAIEAGCALPITLGPRVLRVETAAIYCLSVLSYELQMPDRQ